MFFQFMECRQKRIDELFARKEELLGELADIDSELLCAFDLVPSNIFQTECDGETFSDLDCSTLRASGAPKPSFRLVPSVECREHKQLILPPFVESFREDLDKFRNDGASLKKLSEIIDCGPFSLIPCKKCSVCKRKLEHVRCLSTLRCECTSVMKDVIESTKFCQSKAGMSTKWDKVLRCKLFFSNMKKFIDQCVDSFLK